MHDSGGQCRTVLQTAAAVTAHLVQVARAEQRLFTIHTHAYRAPARVHERRLEERVRTLRYLKRRACVISVKPKNHP